MIDIKKYIGIIYNYFNIIINIIINIFILLTSLWILYVLIMMFYYTFKYINKRKECKLLEFLLWYTVIYTVIGLTNAVGMM